MDLGQCEFKWTEVGTINNHTKETRVRRCHESATVTIAGPSKGENPMNVCSNHEAIIADMSFGDYTEAIKQAKALEANIQAELEGKNTEDILKMTLDLQDETDKELQKILQSLEWNVFRMSEIFQIYIDDDKPMPIEVVVSIKKITDLLGEGLGHLEQSYQEDPE